MKQLKSKSLKDYTSFHIGYKAEIFIPESIQELTELLHDTPDPIILGGGTNILFHNDTKRPIILTTSVQKVTRLGQGSVRVECGKKMGNILPFAQGVPATCGGMVYMNFGAFNYETGSFVRQAICFNKNTKHIDHLSHADCCFKYRSSIFQKNQYVILEVDFQFLDPLYEPNKLLEIRKKKTPMKLKNTGSVFKNPKGNKTAGELIEQAGCKNFKVGGAAIWDKHCNYIINTGKATSDDVLELIKKIKEKVKKKFKISLEEEICIY
ncbi:UDP-N-acetylmuramate dehydrogenase [Candidatus Margulisiibacteriota bacterium]